MHKCSFPAATHPRVWLSLVGLLLGPDGPGLAADDPVDSVHRGDSSASSTRSNLAGAVDAGTAAAYEQTVKNSAPSFGNDELNRKMFRLWSDVPDYVLQLQPKRNSIRKPAQLVSSVVPVYPPVLLPSDGEASVLVSFVVDENGAVEAARTLETTDARFNQAALDAIRQWRFAPAQSADGPTKMFLSVPLVFQGTNWAANPINLEAQPITFSRNLRSGSNLPIVRMQLRGAVTAEVKAARVIVTHAQDDTGLALRQDGTPVFYYPAVGSSSRDDFTGRRSPSLSATLTPAAPTANSITSLEGMVELVIPALDPNATAVIEDLPTKAGTTVESPALRKAGVTLEIFDQRAYDARLATYHDQQGGLTDYGIGVYLDPTLLDKNVSHEQIQQTIEQLRSQDRPLKATDRDIALGITDPENRLVALEFRAADGAPLIYNRNGWAHFSVEHWGRHLDFYRLEAGIPSGLQLVCWLLTPKSLVQVPLKLADLSLPVQPEKPARQPLTPSAP